MATFFCTGWRVVIDRPDEMSSFTDGFTRMTYPSSAGVGSSLNMSLLCAMTWVFSEKFRTGFNRESHSLSVAVSNKAYEHWFNLFTCDCSREATITMSWSITHEAASIRFQRNLLVILWTKCAWEWYWLPSSPLELSWFLGGMRCMPEDGWVCVHNYHK